MSPRWRGGRALQHPPGSGCLADSSGLWTLLSLQSLLWQGFYVRPFLPSRQWKGAARDSFSADVNYTPHPHPRGQQKQLHALGRFQVFSTRCKNVTRQI